MSSCAASYCTCSRKVSCAFGTSASSPTGSVLFSCPFAFSCSARHRNRRRSKRPQPPMARSIFGSALGVVDRWWLSRYSLPPRSSSALHRPGSRVHHETTLHSTKTLHALAPSTSLRLVAERTSPPQLGMCSTPRDLPFRSASQRPAPSSAVGRTAPSHHDTTSPLNSKRIRPAPAATAGGFLQVVVSKAREHTLLPFPLPSKRASDTTLRLHRIDPGRGSQIASGLPTTLSQTLTVQESCTETLTSKAHRLGPCE